MNKLRLLSGSALGSAAVLGMMLAAAPAYAQTPDPVNPGGDPCQAPATQEAAEECAAANADGSPPNQAATTVPEEGIVVVGSRIRRNQFNTADPI